MNNMTEPAPVVGPIAFAVSDQPYSKAGEFGCFPRRSSEIPFVLGLANSVPIESGECNARPLFVIFHAAELLCESHGIPRRRCYAMAITPMLDQMERGKI